MSWSEKIASYVGRKYLGEIARDIWDYYRKVKTKPAEESLPISYQAYLIFNHLDQPLFPAKIKAMIEKGFIQNTFISDWAQAQMVRKGKTESDSLSKAEIERAAEKIAYSGVASTLPDLENLLFREGMNEKQYAWSQAAELLHHVSTSNSEFATLSQNLDTGKLICWEKNFPNMNIRHPELYRIFEYSQELKPEKESFCKEFECSNVEFDRHPPFFWFALIFVPNTSGLIVSFQE